MESREIKLTLEQARELYKQGGIFKKLALSAYDEKELMLPVMERIKTFADAIKELGDDNYLVREYRDAAKLMPYASKDLFAYLKLRIICAALNEGWEPQFTKDEFRYTPYFLISAETKSMLYGGYSYDGADAFIGPCLCFLSKELAEYCGRQFIHFWEDYLLK